MEIKVDTKHDSHDDIKKVIKMLQHIVGDDFSQPSLNVQQEAQPISQPIISNSEQNINDLFSQSSPIAAAQESLQEITQEAQPELLPVKAEEKSETDDLFAELFSEDEIKNMEPEPAKETEEEEPKQKSSYRIEIY